MLIKFSGLLKTEATGEWETNICAHDIADLIDKLINKYGREFEIKIINDGYIRWNILILINGHLLSPIDISKPILDKSTNEKIMKTKLREDDIVSIFELVCG
jgi:hypothetical protein